jgi:hypothetical protein
MLDSMRAAHPALQAQIDGYCPIRVSDSGRVHGIGFLFRDDLHREPGPRRQLLAAPIAIPAVVLEHRY